MREYITTNIIDINCGRIGLDENQAGCRGPSLNKINNGVYEVLAPVKFKAGEKINLDNPDKVSLTKLELTKKGRAQEIKEKKAAIEAEVQKRLAEEKAKADAEAKKKAEAEEKAKADAEAKKKAEAEEKAKVKK